MNVPEFFVQRWEAEQPAFARVLRALPADQLEYKPHDRSNSAGAIAWQLVIEQRDLVELLEKGEIHFAMTPPPAAEQIVAAWDEATTKLRTALEKISEEQCARPSTMFMGGNGVWTDTSGNMLWGYLFDMVHHRGQLSAYLRPMGGKVPSIYGPSGDDNGQGGA